MRQTTKIALLGIFLTIALNACLSPISDKINFDITQISAEGLLNGVSVAYEFCIPNNAVYITKIKDIDANVEFYEGSPGRIGCSKEQVLCISDTHQDKFQKVLRNLAGQDFIEKINQCFFE